MNIMFHYLHGDGHKPSPGSLSAEQLEKLLDAYPDATLVFDDGLKCQFDIAFPVLEKMGRKGIFCILTGHLDGPAPRVAVYRDFMNQFERREDFYTWFYVKAGLQPAGITGDWPDFYTEADRAFQCTRNALPRGKYEAVMDTWLFTHGAYETPEQIGKRVYMTAGDIKTLAKHGHSIGLHSHTHPMNMGELSAKDQRLEWQQNYDWVYALAGKRPNYMSHPSNSYSEVTLAILETLVPYGFRADECEDTWLNQHEMPRIDVRTLCDRMGI